MLKHARMLALVLPAALLPLAAAAEKPDHAGKGKGKPAVAQKHDAPRHMPMAAKDDRHPATTCPPGLAKKSPGCVPPGQAKKGVVVGRAYPAERFHWITRPGLYGLREPPSGMRYGVIDGQLVRVDGTENRVRSIIRAVDAILD